MKWFQINIGDYFGIICAVSYELYLNYRKLGAGKPCAGHKMEIIPLDLTIIGRVSSDESLGEVDEIGS